MSVVRAAVCSLALACWLLDLCHAETGWLRPSPGLSECLLVEGKTTAQTAGEPVTVIKSSLSSRSLLQFEVCFSFFP